MKSFQFVPRWVLFAVVTGGIVATLSSCHRGYGCPGHITQVPEIVQEIC